MNSWNTIIIFKLNFADFVQYSVTLTTNNAWYLCKQNVLQHSYPLDSLVYIYGEEEKIFIEKKGHKKSRNFLATETVWD